MFTNRTLPKHIKSVDTGKMSRKEWEDFRSSLSTLGGSDVGACVGLSRWKSNIELFYEKLRMYKKEFHDSVPMIMGRELEDNIRKLFAYYDVENPDDFVDNYAAKNKVNSVRQRKATFFNERMPELHANIDGICKLAGRESWGILEIKYQSGQAVRMWENNLNPSYIAQLITYMEIMEAEYGVLIVIEDANKWHVHVIERNQNFWGNIYPTIQEFYSCVKIAETLIDSTPIEAEQFSLAASAEPPSFQEQSKPYESFLSSYAKAKETQLIIEGTQEMLDTALEIKTLQDEMTNIEDKQRHLKNQVRKYMIDNQAQVINFGDKGSITYRNQLRFNIKA